MLRLSVCIPTYNRVADLKGCLETLLPQCANGKQVEVIVSDNASTDNSKELVQQYQERYSCLRYFRNEDNLGFDGNTVKCIDLAQGKYTALLADDDRYLSGQIDRILQIISHRDYALINLNYYGFLNDLHISLGTYAPDKDVVFSRAYDVLNYPSVGHFSGFVYNSKWAKSILTELLAKRPLHTRDRSRGIYLELAARVTVGSGMPAYFVGQRGLAGGLTLNVNYNTLEDFLHYYRLFHGLFVEGLISQSDLDYRRRIVLSRLARAIVSSTPKIEEQKRYLIKDELVSYFLNERKFKLLYYPLLGLSRYFVVRFIFSIMGRVSRLIRVNRIMIKLKWLKKRQKTIS